MGRMNMSMNVTLLLLALSGLFVSKTAGINSEHDLGTDIALELCEILRESTSLPRAYSNEQNIRFKRKGIAGLENLDLMSGIFSKLPMRTSAGISDMQALMREVGRRRK